MTRLVTERLILRAARDEDLGPLFTIFSNPRAMAYWSTPPVQDINVTRAWIEKTKKSLPRRYFVLEHQGVVIGTGGIHSDNEIGFILHPDHWRKGFMREAMLAVIAHIWATTDFAKITADADPDNIASVGFLAGLGFHETHRAKNTFCIDGRWTDSVYFALARPGLSIAQ